MKISQLDMFKPIRKHFQVNLFRKYLNLRDSSKHLVPLQERDQVALRFGRKRQGGGDNRFYKTKQALDTLGFLYLKTLKVLHLVRDDVVSYGVLYVVLGVDALLHVAV